MPNNYASNPNQFNITVHKNTHYKDFMQIDNKAWMEVNKQFSPYALQLYLYLAKNSDNYNFWFSPALAREEAGIKETSYRKYFKILMDAGYIVPKGNNKYDFFETPHLPNDTSKSQCDTLNSQYDTAVSSDNENTTQGDTEINNKYFEDKPTNNRTYKQNAFPSEKVLTPLEQGFVF